MSVDVPERRATWAFLFMWFPTTFTRRRQNPTQLDDNRALIACVVGLGLIVISLLLKWGVLQEVWALIGG